MRLRRTRGLRLLVFLFASAAGMGLAVLLVWQPFAARALGDGKLEPSGMVWERHGDWHLNGSATQLRLGEAVPTGGLLTADPAGGVHSLVILLPDGQRMLDECYEPKTCAQGFRVPAITPPPTPAVWEMFVAVRNVLLLRPATDETAFPVPIGRAAMAGNFEIVVPVGQQDEISIAPALTVLPSGRYSLSVDRDWQQSVVLPPLPVQQLNWTKGQKAAQVLVDGPGLYRIRVSDQAFVSRIVVEVLATSPASVADEAVALKQVRDTVRGWNHLYGGWNLHDFLRVYLQSRVHATAQ